MQDIIAGGLSKQDLGNHHADDDKLKLNSEEVRQDSWSLGIGTGIEAPPPLNRLIFEPSLDNQRSSESTPTPESPEWWSAAGDTRNPAHESTTYTSRLAQTENFGGSGHTKISKDQDEDPELADNKVNNSALQRRCKDAMLSIADLESENAEIIARVHAAEHELLQGREERAQQQKDSQKERAALQQQCKEQKIVVKDLEGTIEQQKDAIQLLQEEKLALEEAAGDNRGIEAESKALKGEVEEVKAAMLSQEAEIHALEQENLQLQEQLQASDEACEDLKSSIEELKHDKAGLETSASELQRTVRAHVATEQGLRLQIADLEAQARLIVFTSASFLFPCYCWQCS